ncbi:hypothetical protein GUJ93_ZPchr0008g11667 [Zizania palustris]|uniref:Uncharacterized protein n=1 Tax=Zizania palustris TaxID=103762 RepID=A0A8J5RD78_ZIZPA|nr:hypothetical protein GUJ93_ZPchr0008g11667 [Zizania palustris]
MAHPTFFSESPPSCPLLLFPSQSNRAPLPRIIGFLRSIPTASSMATLTMQPIGSLPSTQEGSSKKPAGGGADLSDIDSGWVVLGKSDIVPADLAAQSLSSSLTIPSWARRVLGGMLHTVVPFYQRVRFVEDETVQNVETAVEVVEHIAQVTEKLAANVADQLPENGCLYKAVEKVEYVAELVDKDAEKVDAIAEKVCFHNRAFS